MIDSVQHDRQLLALAFLRLRHLQHVQLVPCQLLPELVQHLTVVQVLLDVRHDDSLLDQLVVDPVDDGLEQVANIRQVQAHRLDDRALLVVVQVVIFWRNLRRVGLSRRVDRVLSLLLNVLN